MTEQNTMPDDGAFERALSFFIGACEAPEADMCRFCVGDGPFKFCGKPVSRGCYCAECAKVVYNK